MVVFESFCGFVPGATAGLSSSASLENTAGQASSGTQEIMLRCRTSDEKNRTFENAYGSVMVA